MLIVLLICVPLQRDITEQNSTKLCNVFGSSQICKHASKICGFPLQKLAELRTANFMTVFNWTELFQMSKVGLEFHPLSINARSDYAIGGKWWHSIVGVNETIAGV